MKISKIISRIIEYDGAIFYERLHAKAILVIVWLYYLRHQMSVTIKVLYFI